MYSSSTSLRGDGHKKVSPYFCRQRYNLIHSRFQVDFLGELMFDSHSPTARLLVVTAAVPQYASGNWCSQLSELRSPIPHMSVYKDGSRQILEVSSCYLLLVVEKVGLKGH